MAERGVPEGARSLSELLEQREQWKAEVGRTFSSTRSARGQSQSAFAAALDISQPYLSQIESGDRTPSDETLRKLMSLTEGARDGNEDE